MLSFHNLHAARRGTCQNPPRKVTTLHCGAARGSVRCAVNITKRYFKTSSKTSTKKRKRSINPLFFDKYEITDVNGKGICVVCFKELAEESLKPNKLQRHMETHANIAVISEKARKRVFHHRYENLAKSLAVLCRALSQKERIEIFAYKTAFLIAQHNQPFTKGETIIKPTLKNFCKIFEGKPFARKVHEAVNDSALSNNTITRCIETIAADLKEQILESFRNSPWTALAVDESTDNSAGAAPNFLKISERELDH